MKLCRQICEYVVEFNSFLICFTVYCILLISNHRYVGTDTEMYLLYINAEKKVIIRNGMNHKIFLSWVFLFGEHVLSFNIHVDINDGKNGHITQS